MDLNMSTPEQINASYLFLLFICHMVSHLNTALEKLTLQQTTLFKTKKIHLFQLALYLLFHIQPIYDLAPVFDIFFTGF